MKIKKYLLFILILFAGISLRIYHLGRYNFWYDEAFSLLTAIKIDSFSLTDYRYPVHPPLFFLLLNAWSHLGNSEFVLRLLPAIFGVLSIAGIYFTGKALSGKKTGLAAAFILALSPLHIYYSQELTAYTLFVFLALAVIYYLIRSLKENKASCWLAFIVFSVFFLYSHSLALFLIITLNIFFFSSYKNYKFLLPRWLISQFIIFLFYLPWAKVLFEKLSYAKASNYYQWIPDNPLLNITTTFSAFNLGYYTNRIMDLFIVLLFSPLFLLAVWSKRDKESLRLLFSLLFIPIISFMIFSALVFPVYLIRSLIYASLAYYLIIAYALSNLKTGKLYLYFLLAFIFLAGSALKIYYANSSSANDFYYRIGINRRMEFRAPANYISQNYQKGDIVAHPSEPDYPQFLYYHDYKLEEKILVLDHRNNAYLVYAPILKKLDALPVHINEIKKSGYKRIWFVSPNLTDIKRKKISQEIKNYLDRNYLLIKNKEFTDFTVYLYQI